MTTDEIRALFPATRDLLYFNAAAQSLLPTPVAERVAEVFRRQTERGIFAFPREMQEVERARRAGARLLGCTPTDVAFTANTTEGVARIAAGIDWRDGDEVVLADLEFPSNVFPWAAQQDRGARLRWVRSEQGRVEPQQYLDAIGPRTRVVAVSHVQFGAGYRIDLAPLAAACRERDALLFVDAIQSLGIVPLNVTTDGIGALAVDGRKWLMGPQACGLLYVSPEWAGRIRTHAAGVPSVENSEEFMQFLDWIDDDGRLDLEPHLRDGALRFDSGFPNVAGAAGLCAALELAESIGRDRIHETIAAHVARFVERLDEAGYPVHGPRDAGERAGIVAFDVPVPADELFRKLNAEKCSVSPRGGRIRVSPHVYNTADEIDRLMERIRKLVG